MQLKQLTYFVTVVECGSFRRAAEELYLAQSSLSRQEMCSVLTSCSIGR